MKPVEKNVRRPHPGHTPSALPASTHHCAGCHRELPLTAFYRIGHDRHADGYCKECRKRISRCQRAGVAAPRHPRRVDLTTLPDRKQRIALIVRAKRVVAERILRRRQQEEEEF